MKSKKIKELPDFLLILLMICSVHICFMMTKAQAQCIDMDQDNYTIEGGECIGQPCECVTQDCDDTDPAINPSAEEVCDDIDNNCNGEVDEGDVCEPEVVDSDGDGIPDDEDICPKSTSDGSIVIDECDTGVENLLLDAGCKVSDEIAVCANDVNNHGQYVRCVSQLTNVLKSDGLITGKEKGAIQKCAAKADIP